MRPVELSEPSSEQNSLKTEDFDVNSALSELEGMKPQRSKDTVDTPNSESQESSQNSSSSESSEESNSGGFLSLLKSLF
jgi:hypothetical protein